MENQNKHGKVLPIVIGAIVLVAIVVAIVLITRGSNSQTAQTNVEDYTTSTEETQAEVMDTSLTEDTTLNTSETSTTTEVVTTEVTTTTTTLATTVETTPTPTQATTLATTPLETTPTPTEVETEPPVSISTGEYEGVEPFSRAILNVSTAGDTVTLSIHWADSAFAYSLWTISGTVDPNTNTLEYSNGLLEYIETDMDTGEQFRSTESTTESGHFEFDTGGLIYWVPNDDTLSYYGETSIAFAQTSY
jgi:hypothetical protein